VRVEELQRESKALIDQLNEERAQRQDLEQQLQRERQKVETLLLFPFT